MTNELLDFFRMVIEDYDMRVATGHNPDYGSPLRVPRSVVEAMRAAVEPSGDVRAALVELESMYSRTWDRVDGALVMLPDSIPKFEAAHRKARIALGIPFVDDEASENRTGDA